MHDVAVPYVYPDMSHVIEYITRLGIFHAIHGLSVASLIIGSPGKAVSKMLIHRLSKSGTVTPVGKTRSTGHIRIADKLLGVGGYL